MSRIGKKIILIPDSVNIIMDGANINCTGPLGSLDFEIPARISAEVSGNSLSISRHGNDKMSRALHGTARQIIANMIIGVDSGFEKTLEIIGVGYRVALEGSTLVINIGYSHPVKLEVPSDLKAKVEKNKITISGVDKQRVGQFAAIIREVRKPEPYKGKGIKYSGEIIKRKAGKAAKAAK